MTARSSFTPWYRRATGQPTHHVASAPDFNHLLRSELQPTSRAPRASSRWPSAPCSSSPLTLSVIADLFRGPLPHPLPSKGGEPERWRYLSPCSSAPTS